MKCEHTIFIDNRLFKPINCTQCNINAIQNDNEKNYEKFIQSLEGKSEEELSRLSNSLLKAEQVLSEHAKLLEPVVAEIKRQNTIDEIN